jgi:hypothetical protein
MPYKDLQSRCSGWPRHSACVVFDSGPASGGGVALRDVHRSGRGRAGKERVACARRGFEQRMREGKDASTGRRRTQRAWHIDGAVCGIEDAFKGAGGTVRRRAPEDDAGYGKRPYGEGGDNRGGVHDGETAVERAARRGRC